MVIGVVIGVICGAIPGMSATMAVALTLAWVIAVGTFCMRTGGMASDRNVWTAVMTLLAVFLPIAMIWVAAMTARNVRGLREEAARLQAAVDGLRAAYVQQSQASALGLRPSVERKLDEIAAVTRHVGLIATVIALLLGIPVAYAFSRMPPPGIGAIRQILTSPLIIPAILVGLGLLHPPVLTINAPVYVGLLIGPLALLVPYSVRGVYARLVKLSGGI